MKTKIRFKENGKIIEELEFKQRNLLHFEIQKNTRAKIFKNKKKYNRKHKHKLKLYDYE